MHERLMIYHRYLILTNNSHIFEIRLQIRQISRASIEDRAMTVNLPEKSLCVNVLESTLLPHPPHGVKVPSEAQK